MNRLAWVFASVEAIAFGAAGLLFGSTIQKDRAERAEADAGGNAQAAAPRDAAASVAARHAEVARKLFP